MRKFHYIYKITRFDGMYYWGRHSTVNLYDGYFGSGTRLWESILQWGKEKHSIEYVEFISGYDKLKAREKEIVNQEMLKDPLCLNKMPGGAGGFSSVQQQKNASAAGNRSPKRDHVKIHEKANKTKQERGSQYIPPPDAWIKTGASAAAQTDIAKKKRKDTMKARSHMQGEKNSQYGTLWITNGSACLKIKQHQLDAYLKEGYLRGRKLIKRS